MIDVSFTFTPDKYVDAIHHLRRQYKLSRLFASMVVILGVFLVTVGLHGSIRWQGYSQLFALYFCLPHRTLLIGSHGASFHKLPFCNKEVVQRFDETGLLESTGESDSHFDWSTFTKVVHFDDGILLFSGPKFIRWIPVDAFVNPNQITDFQQLLRANVNEHEVGGQVNKKELKDTLKTLALAFYLGLTGDDFSRKERSKTFRWSIRGFWLSFLSLIAVASFGSQNIYWMSFAMAAVCLLLISGITFIFSIAARDIPKWKQNNWRFSIRDLLIVITVIALALGGIIFAARN